MIVAITGKSSYAEIKQVKKIDVIKDKDNIVFIDLGKEKVVASKDFKVGELAVYFKHGTLISSNFAQANRDLLKYSNTVKKRKIAGLQSEGLLLPLSAIQRYTSFDVEIQEGLRFNRWNVLTNKLFDTIQEVKSLKKEKHREDCKFIKNKNEEFFEIKQLENQKEPKINIKKTVQVLPVEDVLNIIKQGYKKVFINNERVGVYSVRLQTFLKSQTCACCGAKAIYFRIEKPLKDIVQKHGGHLELYCEKADGTIDMMTKDHIYPKSRGGSESLDNMQTMCLTCNMAKGNII